jgi:hypothetical protein
MESRRSGSKLGLLPEGGRAFARPWRRAARQEETLAGRTATEGELFHWWWDLGTVTMDLEVVWEMSVE